MLVLCVLTPFVLEAVYDIRAPVDGSVKGKKPGIKVYVASATVIMGWIFATGVCQHLHRNMLRTGFAGSAGSLLKEGGAGIAPAPLRSKHVDARAWQFPNIAN